MNAESTAGSVSILGTGNLGHHLAAGLAAAGVRVSQVFSRQSEHAQKTAEITGAGIITNLDDLHPDSEICIITVPDDHIADLATHPTLKNRFQVHCSGAVSVDVLTSEKRGVLYPLQSFSRDVAPDWNTIPFCIEASDLSLTHTLSELAHKLGGQVYSINSEKRLLIHLAAVFAGNFTNHMLTLAREILRHNNLPPELTDPLYLYSAEKAVRLGPDRAQTGPAIRRDLRTLEKHQALLDQYPPLKKIYTLLSQSIADADEQSNT